MPRVLTSRLFPYRHEGGLVSATELRSAPYVSRAGRARRYTLAVGLPTNTQIDLARAC